MPSKHKLGAAASIEVPPALPADEAARLAFEHDRALTRHHF